MLDLLIVALDDTIPKPSEVKAGPLGAAVFVFLILAMVVIGFSLRKQLRKADTARDSGVYGDVGPKADSSADTGGYDTGGYDGGGSDGGGGGGD